MGELELIEGSKLHTWQSCEIKGKTQWEISCKKAKAELKRIRDEWEWWQEAEDCLWVRNRVQAWVAEGRGQAIWHRLQQVAEGRGREEVETLRGLQQIIWESEDQYRKGKGQPSGLYEGANLAQAKHWRKIVLAAEELEVGEFRAWKSKGNNTQPVGRVQLRASLEDRGHTRMTISALYCKREEEQQEDQFLEKLRGALEERGQTKIASPELFYKLEEELQEDLYRANLWARDEESYMLKWARTENPRMALGRGIMVG